MKAFFPSAAQESWAFFLTISVAQLDSSNATNPKVHASFIPFPWTSLFPMISERDNTSPAPYKALLRV
jgi:hypothetical protein